MRPDDGRTLWGLNVFKQIFADHRDEFKCARPRYQTFYYDGLIAKMLGCGKPEPMSYVEYRCQQCDVASGVDEL